MTPEFKFADLGRLQEIIGVFSLAGFGDIFKQMGLEDAADAAGSSEDGEGYEGEAEIDVSFSRVFTNAPVRAGAFLFARRSSTS